MPQREAYLEHDTNSTDQPGGRVTRDPYVVSGLKTMGGREPPTPTLKMTPKHFEHPR